MFVCPQVWPQLKHSCRQAHAHAHAHARAHATQTFELSVHEVRARNKAATRMSQRGFTKYLRAWAICDDEKIAIQSVIEMKIYNQVFIWHSPPPHLTQPPTPLPFVLCCSSFIAVTMLRTHTRKHYAPHARAGACARLRGGCGA